MKPFTIKKKVIEWVSYFVTSKGDIHKFTFSNKQTAECVMCMFLSVQKCSWIEKKEKYVWINVEYLD